MKKQRKKPFYNNNILDWVWQLSLRPEFRVLMWALADHADQDGGSCHPIIETLADMCCLSKRRVIQLLDALEAAGLISIKRGGPHRASNYQLHIGATLSGPLETPPHHPERKKGNPFSVHPGTPNMERQSVHPGEPKVGTARCTRGNRISVHPGSPEHNNKHTILHTRHQSMTDGERLAPSADRQKNGSAQEASPGDGVTQPTAGGKPTNAGTEDSAPGGTANSGHPGERRQVAAKRKKAAQPWPSYMLIRFAEQAGVAPKDVLAKCAAEAKQFGLPWPPNEHPDDRASWDEHWQVNSQALARGLTGTVEWSRGLKRLRKRHGTEKRGLPSEELARAVHEGWLQHDMINRAKGLRLDPLDVVSLMIETAHDHELPWPPEKDDQPDWRQWWFQTCNTLADGYEAVTPPRGLDELCAYHHPGEAKH